MDFLVPYMGNRPREGNLELESEETQHLPQNADTADSDTSVHENGNTENLSAEENTETEHLLNESTVSYSDTSKSMPETTVQKNKRMKKDDIASIFKESMIRREKRAEERAIERKKNSEEAVKPQRGDGLQNFFLAMYEIAREMPATYQHVIRNKVYQAVSEVEAEYLQLGTSSRQHFSQTGPQTPILHELQPTPQRAYSPSTSYSHASYSSFTSTPLQSPDTGEPEIVSAQSDTASFFHNFSV